MYPLMFLAKCLVVLVFGAAGVLSLSRGFGLPIPFLEYGALEAWNVIAGAGLLAVSLGCAFFWRAPKRRRAMRLRRDSYVSDKWLLPAGTTTAPQLKHRR